MTTADVQTTERPLGDVFIQPKITGYRQLSVEEVALMNEGKALAEAVGVYVEKLRAYRATTSTDVVTGNVEALGAEEKLPQGEQYGVNFVPPTKDFPEHDLALDQRWISIGKTNLQQGFMALIRAIARPTTF